VKIIASIGLIVAAVVGFFTWANVRTKHAHARSTRTDVEQALEELVSPDSTYLDTWDLFIAWPIDDPYLESIRQRCLRVVEECTPEKPTEYISQTGVQRVRAMLAELRAHT
jgi:hypothetical protein